MPPSFMYDTTVVLSVATSTILFAQRSWNSLKSEKLLKVLDILYATCFREEARLLLQSAHLSERPTLLLMRL